MATRESEVARLAEQQALLNVSPELEADMDLLRRTLGIPPDGILSGILARHPEWEDSLDRANRPVGRWERRLLADPWVREAVEGLVKKYRFPLRRYFAERLIWGEPLEPDWVIEDLVEYELELLEAAERDSAAPPLWTGTIPDDPLGLGA